MMMLARGGGWRAHEVDDIVKEILAFLAILAFFFEHTGFVIGLTTCLAQNELVRKADILATEAISR